MLKLCLAPLLVLGTLLMGCSEVQVRSIQEQPLPKEIPAKDIDHSELFILARNIYHEARGEPIECQYLVAAVTLNRVSDKRWPDTVKEVILSPWQFSWTNQDVPLEKDDKAWTLSLQIAQQALEGFTEGMSPSFWYHTKAVNPSWNRNLIPAEECGNHIFWMDGV